MMQNSIILQNVDEARLKEIVSEAIREQLAIDSPKTDKFISRAEARKRLGICYPTLDRALSQGVLKGYRIGGRILLKESEIELSPFNKSQK
jgi:excisionase family DNA binding protein